jgi:DNA-binding NtrC family response regulator
MSRTVLVVDDDLDLRVALEEVLTDAGYHAVLAQSAEHALQLLDTVSRPCLVLLDYAMPGAGAEGFLSAIQERADAESFAVVLMTGMPRVALPSDTRIAGQLSKPFEMDDLLVVLESHCGSGRPSSAAS